MHNACVADEEADALSGTHQLFSSATQAPTVRHQGHTGWVGENNKLPVHYAATINRMRSTDTRGFADGLMGLVVGFFDSQADPSPVRHLEPVLPGP